MDYMITNGLMGKINIMIFISLPFLFCSNLQSIIEGEMANIRANLDNRKLDTTSLQYKNAGIKLITMSKNDRPLKSFG